MSNQPLKIDEENTDLVYRLRIRAAIRRQATGRKSVDNGEIDRLANLLDEAACEIEVMKTSFSTDTRIGPRAQIALNCKAMSNPEPGDLWCCDNLPPFIVLMVTPKSIVICEKQVMNAAYEDLWSFDLAATSTITYEHLRKIVTRYNDDHGEDEFVANVTPKSRLTPLIEKWQATRVETLKAELGQLWNIDPKYIGIRQH